MEKEKETLAHIKIHTHTHTHLLSLFLSQDSKRTRVISAEILLVGTCTFSYSARKGEYGLEISDRG